jgi:hypothetical protein
MRFARALESSVPAVLPLAGGAVAALVASMAGRRLAPVVLALSLLATFWLARSVRRSAGRDRRRRQLVLALAAIAATVLVAVLAEPTPLTQLTERELEAAVRDDTAQFDALDHGVNALLARLEAEGVPRAGAEVLSAPEEQLLADSWRALVDHAVALESLRRYYDEYYLFDVGDRHDEHAIAFLLTFAADATLYDAAARFTRRVTINENAQKFLDAPRHGIPAQSFSRFREDLLGAGDQLRIGAGEAYLQTIEPSLNQGSFVGPATLLVARIRQHLAAIDALPKRERAEQTYRAELQSIKRSAVRAWYPLQKRAAELLGDTRVRRPGRYLIDHQLSEHVDAQLAPGDILLSRKNWYLSNIGLPGFWPHAMLYLGDVPKLDAYFDDPEMRSWLESGGGFGTLSEMLAARYPKAWAAYSALEHDESHRVIEAVSEGVVFSTLDHCAGDYFAAMRPRMRKVDKAVAIAFAFSQHEKPYDFDFDFATDHALVCTELVWRSYRNAAVPRSLLDFTLVEVAGRMTLPAHEMVTKYAREAGTPGAQLDFVVFIDAREDLHQAFVSTEEAFRATANRTKWDIAQE